MASGSALALAWLIGSFIFVLPVADAEGEAHMADEALRRGEAAQAAALYRNASDHMPLNADYAYRSARAMIYANESPQRILAMISTAIARDPSQTASYLTRALYYARVGETELAKADFEKAIALDPNNVQTRLDYAKALTEMGDKNAAILQYSAALAKDDELHPDEPKRLSAEQREQIKQKARALAQQIELKP